MISMDLKDMEEMNKFGTRKCPKMSSFPFSFPNDVIMIINSFSLKVRPEFITLVSFSLLRKQLTLTFTPLLKLI